MGVPLSPVGMLVISISTLFFSYGGTVPPHIAVGVNLAMYQRRASVEKRDIASKVGQTLLI